MLRDHNKLKGLLTQFKKVAKTNQEARSVMFNMFKWELEKHFFTEDKAIFLFYEPEDDFNNNPTHELVDQHDKILKELDKIEKDLRAKKDLNFESFEKLLIEHGTYENNELYPLLDRVLSAETKKMIFDRISNPI